MGAGVSKEEGELEVSSNRLSLIWRWTVERRVVKWGVSYVALANANQHVAFGGAADRALGALERELAINGAPRPAFARVWDPPFAPVRKTERTFVRRARLSNYWRANGQPDLCQPIGAYNFVCD